MTPDPFSVSKVKTSALLVDWPSIIENTRLRMSLAKRRGMAQMHLLLTCVFGQLTTKQAVLGQLCPHSAVNAGLAQLSKTHHDEQVRAKPAPELPGR
jgi:hypothetical protein